MIRVQLAPGVHVDVYDVHLDAGASPGDVAARAGQLRQLMAVIGDLSGDGAALVGGDFNLTAPERAPYHALSAAAGLVDVCARLRCAEPWRLDRWLVRSSPALKLEPRSWRVDRSFQDPEGKPLSDHFAVAVELDWMARN